MKKGEEVTKQASPAALKVIQKMKDQKEAINAYFDGKLTITELNAKGVNFVKTI